MWRLVAVISFMGHLSYSNTDHSPELSNPLILLDKKVSFYKMQIVKFSPLNRFPKTSLDDPRQVLRWREIKGVIMQWDS